MKTSTLHRISFSALLAALLISPHSPAETPPTGGGDIAAALKPFVDRGLLAGAVTLVADETRVLNVASIGFADVAAKKAMSTDALFWIASQSKPITATALMILVDEGKVKLDDPVGKYLPEFKDQWVVAVQEKDRMVLQRPKAAMTVRHLLNHTSGMPFRSAMEQPTLDMLSLRDAVRSYAMTPLLSEPGTRFLYSNAGINTAGRIIEVVSGTDYESFLQKRLFDPLEMKDTTFRPDEGQLKRLAKAYRPNAAKTGLEGTTLSQLTHPLNERKRQPMPAGGLFSTAKDVGNFCRMILAGGVWQGKRILSKEAVEEMSRRQTGALKNSYGLGWSVGDGSFGHGGAYATNMTIDTKRGLVLVFLVQHAGFPGDGAKSLGAFRKAGEDRFGGPKK